MMVSKTRKLALELNGDGLLHGFVLWSGKRLWQAFRVASWENAWFFKKSLKVEIWLN